MQARVVLGTALLVLLSSLTACSEEKAELSAGDIVRARQDDQFESGRRTTITMPVGRLLVWTEDPVESAGADETRTRQTVDAPAGAVLVPITWQYDPWASNRLDGIVDTSDTPRINLVTETESYRVPPPERDAEGNAESFYVVADGDAEERTLEIEFDGVTQTLDLASGERDEGIAAALYDIEDDQLKKTSCTDEKWFDPRYVSADFTCNTVGPVITPYAAGEWAPEGSVWLAVTLTTRMGVYAETDLLGSGARYFSRGVKVTAEIDREKADYTLVSQSDLNQCPVPGTNTCAESTTYVFEVPEEDPEQGPFVVELTYKQVEQVSYGQWDEPRKRKVVGKEKLYLWKDPKDKKRKKNRDDESEETSEELTEE
ncbi:hypothetical protein [Nocardioides stalactiti]|uniref:hypothetical protein n=1 Tax=Nocardioides stalactiti TaxID=2755356 RepID=UPI001602FD2E|nr:hypothetical protein [Nocardioides stalactiti]